jgi:hypothetical protein
MQGRVAPVTARTALGRRKDASVLVVADGLSGQPVLPRKVDRSIGRSVHLRLKLSTPADRVYAVEVSPDSSRIRLRVVPS